MPVFRTLWGFHPYPNSCKKLECRAELRPVSLALRGDSGAQSVKSAWFFVREETMRRSNVGLWTLIALVGLFGDTSVLPRPFQARAARESNTPVTERPGDAAYTPTKLEWAALELQANFGTNWTSENPIAGSFSPLGDGTTVQCLLQYTPDISAETVKTERDLKQIEFERYVRYRGWSWLRLQFQEKTLPRPSR